MNELLLRDNQAALILTYTEDGEMTVDIAYGDTLESGNSFAAAICEVIGRKLTQDVEFQEQILSEIPEDDSSD